LLKYGEAVEAVEAQVASRYLRLEVLVDIHTVHLQFNQVILSARKQDAAGVEVVVCGTALPVK
jgi:hypothetical protein